VIEAREAPGPPGTRIEVADLFAAVPARRKFLKTEATEWGHLSDWLARSALARPDVHLEVRREDRPAFAWPAVADPLERMAAVLGEDEAAALVPLDWKGDGMRLWGFASRPDRHRATLAGIYLFVNGRPVRDRLLQHALVDTYRDVLPRGRFPTAVLFLELAPERVDVNVHPAKWEVRFADPQAAHRSVRAAVSRALEGRRWLGGATAAPEGAAPGAFAPFAAGTRASAGGVGGPTAAAGDWVLASARSAVFEGAPAAPGPAGGLVEGEGLRFAEERLLGQLLATYLVLETKRGLVLVDQHAAHERVLYERLRREWRERAVASQGLLVPLPVALEPAAAAALAEAGDSLARLGFEIEPFGEGTVAVRGIPALLAGGDPALLVRELAEELAAGASGGASAPALAAVDRLFAGLACHAARRKGEALPALEQRALLAALDAIPWAPTCPHGRPVAVPLDLAEIERRFARR
jgi:DNA mismatch repair protein MutL